MKKSEVSGKKHNHSTVWSADGENGIGKYSCGKRDEKWDFPVSKKYYAKLKAKVEQIYLDLGHAVSWAEPVMKWINLYLRDGDKPQHRYTDERVMCVFFSLRPEIDEAVRRSALARQRAAERRARKQAEQESIHAESQTNTSKTDITPHAENTDYPRINTEASVYQQDATEWHKDVRADIQGEAKTYPETRVGVQPEAQAEVQRGRKTLPEARAEVQRGRRTLPEARAGVRRTPISP